MLPTRYLPSFAGNTFEARATAFVAQLFAGVPMAKDYDQLLDKRPNKLDAIFAWHQDMVGAAGRRRREGSHGWCL